MSIAVLLYCYMCYVLLVVYCCKHVHRLLHPSSLCRFVRQPWCAVLVAAGLGRFTQHCDACGPEHAQRVMKPPQVQHNVVPTPRHTHTQTDMPICLLCLPRPHQPHTHTHTHILPSIPLSPLYTHVEACSNPHTLSPPPPPHTHRVSQACMAVWHTLPTFGTNGTCWL